MFLSDDALKKHHWMGAFMDAKEKSVREKGAQWASASAATHLFMLAFLGGGLKFRQFLSSIQF